MLANFCHYSNHVVFLVNADPFCNMKKLAVKGGAVVDPDSGEGYRPLKFVE